MTVYSIDPAYPTSYPSILNRLRGRTRAIDTSLPISLDELRRIVNRDRHVAVLATHIRPHDYRRAEDAGELDQFIHDLFVDDSVACPQLSAITHDRIGIDSRTGTELVTYTINLDNVDAEVVRQRGWYTRTTPRWVTMWRSGGLLTRQAMIYTTTAHNLNEESILE